jgi:glycosyltransferase involved in cell wall biosynthesis
LLEYVAEPVTLRAATHVTTVCQYAAGRDFLQPHSAKFAGVIPNGVPIAADPQAGRSRCRREIGLNPDDLVMIAVSRLTWEKGFATLAEALPLLRQQRQRCVLLVVGDGSDRPSIENALRSVDTVDVRFLGRRLDVRDLLAAADLFVFATLHENLSNALLEAMARGLPVVASAVGGNIEVLTRGGGILVPPRDPVAFSAAIEHLLTDAAARHEMGEAAREVVANHYSLDAMLDALDRTYQRILADGR